MYALLDFLTKHAGTLSVALTAALALIVFFIVARATVNSANTGSVLGSNEELEKLLKSLMERTQGTLGQLGGSGGVSSEDSQRLQADLVRLQKELEEKNQQIQELNQKNSSFSIEEHNALKSRLQELEAKLAEYEIIAEDIADLSRYREENQDLKKKIEELEKRAHDVVMSSVGSTSGAEIPPPSPLMELSETPSPTNEVGLPNADSSGNPASTESLIDDALLAEFAAAVEEQKKAQQAKNQTTPAETQPFSESDSETLEPVMDLKDLESEAQNLSELKVADGLNPEKLFESQIDTERLSGEAQALSPKDEARELLGEFEKFVEERKGG